VKASDLRASEKILCKKTFEKMSHFRFRITFEKGKHYEVWKDHSNDDILNNSVYIVGEGFGQRFWFDKEYNFLDYFYTQIESLNLKLKKIKNV